jgi:general secretion pathway protein A
MYEGFYGFREAPFELTSNPRFLFFTAQMCRSVACVFIDNPTLTRAEFFETLASRFELGPSAEKSKAAVLGSLESTLRERHSRGEITALVVDEAQALPDELLEEIRLLANMETPDGKLLPLVLAGQPELAVRLNEPRLRQLKQRIALRCELKPLSLQDTAAYIVSRIRTAGGDPANIFTREAVKLICEYSRGLPRTISVMCDNALMTGFALDRPVDGDIVREVCRDFDLGERPPVAAPRPPHLALVAPEGTEPERRENRPAAAGDSATRQQRDATEPATPSLLKIR